MLSPFDSQDSCSPLNGVQKSVDLRSPASHHLISPRWEHTGGGPLLPSWTSFAVVQQDHSPFQLLQILKTIHSLFLPVKSHFTFSVHIFINSPFPEFSLNALSSGSCLPVILTYRITTAPIMLLYGRVNLCHQ